MIPLWMVACVIVGFGFGWVASHERAYEQGRADERAKIERWRRSQELRR